MPTYNPNACPHCDTARDFAESSLFHTKKGTVVVTYKCKTTLEIKREGVRWSPTWHVRCRDLKGHRS